MYKPSPSNEQPREEMELSVVLVLESHLLSPKKKKKERKRKEKEKKRTKKPRSSIRSKQSGSAARETRQLLFGLEALIQQLFWGRILAFSRLLACSRAAEAHQGNALLSKTRSPIVLAGRGQQDARHHAQSQETRSSKV